MNQILKSYRDLFLAACAVFVVYAIGFLLFSLLFVGVWDWTAEPLFRAPAAPYTAGMGFTIVLSVLLGIIEALKERK